MRNLRSVIFGLSFLIGGVFLANLFGAEAGAQEQTVTEAQAARRRVTTPMERLRNINPNMFQICPCPTQARNSGRAEQCWIAGRGWMPRKGSGLEEGCREPVLWVD